MEERQQMANSSGVASQIDAQRIAAVVEHGLAERLVALEADDTNRITLLKEMIGYAVIVLEWPGTDGQNTAAWVDQHQRFAGNGREIRFESGRFAGDFTFVKDQDRRHNGLIGRQGFAGRMGGRVNRVDHGQQLMAQVTVGVVHHRIGQVAAAVEAFLRMGFETDQNRGAGQIGDQAADSGKQLAVDNDIKTQSAHFLERLPEVARKILEVGVIECHDIFGGDDVEQIEDFAVLGEKHNVQFGTGIARFERPEHRFGQHQTAHFRQQNDQNALRRVGPATAQAQFANTPVPDGEQGAKRHPGIFINSALETDIHQSGAKGKPGREHAGGKA